jgi:hypothetical protein
MTTFINCGKLGDMLMVLPILSWWHKHYGEKPTLMLEETFPYAHESEELLRMQPFIRDVQYFHRNDSMILKPRRWYFDWRHRIDPESMKLDPRSTFALGFHQFPYTYIPRVYCDEFPNRLDYDTDFMLEIGNVDYTYKDKTVKIDKWEHPLLKHIPADVELGQENSMVKNLQLMAGAKKVILTSTGSTVAATLARIPCTVYCEARLLEYHREIWYKPTGCKVEMKTL